MRSLVFFFIYLGNKLAKKFPREHASFLGAEAERSFSRVKAIKESVWENYLTSLQTLAPLGDREGREREGGEKCSLVVGKSNSKDTCVRVSASCIGFHCGKRDATAKKSFHRRWL